MKEVTDALLKVQIALDNDTEVYLSQIEQIEGVCDRIAKGYTGALNVTDDAEHHADSYADAKHELRQLVSKLDKLEEVVSRYEKLATEIDAWTKELDAKVKEADPS